MGADDENVITTCAVSLGYFRSEVCIDMNHDGNLTAVTPIDVKIVHKRVLIEQTHDTRQTQVIFCSPIMYPARANAHCVLEMWRRRSLTEQQFPNVFAWIGDFSSGIAARLVWEAGTSDNRSVNRPSVL